MKKIVCCAVLFVSLLLVNVADLKSESPQLLDKHIFEPVPSDKEKQKKEKELEEFLAKEVKPNSLLPLPDPGEKMILQGMPLPNGEKAEVEKIQTEEENR
ncbi:hypothetical protein F9U64_06515 [Gracilibacillus oryzae]|uniref:Uncharacterized protein n=1 Tax=Gracilibacillus oryzae TaxID=1672701 RepID=A0A7C8GU32_9BACI|nr:hypothetical protein [Gracilibacillus oryzae]KAB8138093.1 hypothetical protein F9U64_06515 [Gracilibacillus oryzae]